ncbi:MAG: hypothetical protein ABIZ07_01630, partial [Dermatophilaceae bacterium]
AEAAGCPEPTPTDPVACPSPPLDPIGADDAVVLAEAPSTSVGPTLTPVASAGDVGAAAGPDLPAGGDLEWV